MKDFSGKIAVIAGGGTGIGGELARQLAQQGCHVAIGDVIAENRDGAVALCASEAPAGTRVTGHLVDVSVEVDMQRFADEVRDQHATNHINLLFNNAGIGGGGSFVKGDRAAWEKTFAVSWYGVYYGSRAFMDMVVASDEGHIVNTSSLNGLWASLGPTAAHTAYSAAKFAIRGFSEALITDLRLHAPHVGVSVVFPGAVGTSMVVNTSKVTGTEWGMEATDEEVAANRRKLEAEGIELGDKTDQDVRELLGARAMASQLQSPTSSAEAARIILEGVRENNWRILVGDDVKLMDHVVRTIPELVYEPDLAQRVAAMDSGDR